VENEVNSLDVGSWTPLLGLRLTLKFPEKVLGETFIKGAKPEGFDSQVYMLVTSENFLKSVSIYVFEISVTVCLFLYT
jgi:hypothetical protein